MRNEYDKCYFCKSYDEYEGCEWGCEDKKDFEPNHDRIIAKAKAEVELSKQTQRVIKALEDYS